MNSLMLLLLALSPHNQASDLRTIRLTAEIVYDVDSRAQTRRLVSPNATEVTLDYGQSIAKCIGFVKACEARVDKRATSVRIIINVPGFERYTVNIPKLAFNQHDIATVDLGRIMLRHVSAPQMANIVMAHGPDNQQRLTIVVRNPLKEAVLVHRLSLAGTRRETPVQCQAVRFEYFKLNDRVKVSASGLSDKSVIGTFIDGSVGSEFHISMFGTVKYTSCGGGLELDLDMPCSFLLPSDGFTTIRIDFPPFFWLEGKQPRDKIDVSHLDRYTVSIWSNQIDGSVIRMEYANPSRGDALFDVR